MKKGWVIVLIIAVIVLVVYLIASKSGGGTKPPTPATGNQTQALPANIPPEVIELQRLEAEARKKAMETPERRQDAPAPGQ